MKIKSAKFFQVIEIPSNKVSNHDAGTYINDTHHDIVKEGDLVKITHRESGNTVYVTIFNTQYLRAADEQPADTKPKTSPKGSNKEKQDQA